jgi:pantothenate kinase type III
LQDAVGLGSGLLPDAETTGRDLASWIVSQWQAVPVSSLPAAFLEYAIEPGQAWISRSSSAVAIDHGIDDDGALRLGPKDGGPIKLSSAEHDWRWEFQADMPVAIADVGNTRIKIADWPGISAENPSWQATLASGDTSTFDGAHLRGRRVHVVAVSRSNLERLAGLAREFGFGLHVVPKRPVFLRSDYAWDQIGMDRVAALEGFLAGLARHERGDDQSFGIVISAGTATTMDVVSFAGRHLGGIIVPGIATALRSLHEAAPALPDLRAEAHRMPVMGVPGFSTQGAILGGQKAGLVGMVRELIALVATRAAQPGRSVRIVVTGGHARTVLECLEVLASNPVTPCQVKLHEGLVLAGGRVMAAGGTFL